MAERVPEVVIVGGGFGGLSAARALAGAPVRVTLIDRRNFHLFQPLSYQVATGALSPGEVAYPLRSVFKRDGNGFLVKPVRPLAQAEYLRVIVSRDRSEEPTAPAAPATPRPATILP